MNIVRSAVVFRSVSILLPPFDVAITGITQGYQVLLNFIILLLKLQFYYWNFREFLVKILKFVVISQLFLHKNTEISVKLCKNTEIIAICYWSEFADVVVYYLPILNPFRPVAYTW